MEKTLNDRMFELKNIYAQLDSLKIDATLCPNIKQFKSICNEFLKTGISVSGKIKLYEINKRLIYILTNKKRPTIWKAG